jgi:hypothetical protein
MGVESETRWSEEQSINLNRKIGFSSPHLQVVAGQWRIESNACEQAVKKRIPTLVFDSSVDQLHGKYGYPIFRRTQKTSTGIDTRFNVRKRPVDSLLLLEACTSNFRSDTGICEAIYSIFSLDETHLIETISREIAQRDHTDKRSISVRSIIVDVAPRKYAAIKGRGLTLRNETVQCMIAFVKTQPLRFAITPH